MARKLRIENAQGDDRAVVQDVAVLERKIGDSSDMRAVFNVAVIGDVVLCSMYSRSVQYPLESKPEVNTKEGTIKFSSRGTDYVIRAFQDSDKKWFLQGSNKKTASAEQMEKMFIEAIRGRYQ